MPPQDQQMQTAPDPRAELDRLRKIKRLRELEAKAGGQAAAPAGRSLRSETDAIIEEAAANIPGGYDAFNRKPADPQRMAAMGYVADPLAKSGYAKPAAPQAPVVDQTDYNNPLRGVTDYAVNAVRGLEAPIAGLTGGGLTGWAKTTQEDPVLGAAQAVEFLSPVDDAARTYQGVKQAGAGLIEGDMSKAAAGAQQALIDGSYTAMQALPGSTTLRGVTALGRVAPVTLAEAQRAAVQASKAPSVRKVPPASVVASEPPKPFSAPAEPAGGGLVRRNADRIIGGSVGATVGGVGDAYAAPGDGSEGGGGPLNATTGAFLGAFGPRMVASTASRGFRAMARPISPKGFDERVAARAVRNALKAGGIRTPEEAAAAFTARFGDKPASVADLTQEGVSTAAGLSRRSGATGEAARARGEDLLANRAGRLERDIADTTGASPATIAGDVDRMVSLARQQATPAYAALREQNPFGSFASSRLEQLRDLDILRPHLQGADRFRDTIAATEGRVVGDFEYWDLVKRSLDDAEQSAIARNQAVPYDLDSARQAIVREVDALVPEYAAARQLGGEAPRMQEAFRQGQGLLGGRYTAEDVTRLAQGITGQQLTALQAGVIRSMVQKTEGPRGAMAALMAPGARQKLAQVFGPEAADAMQARFAADAAIVNNAQRINPNVGSVTSQAQMGEGGILPMAAEAIRVFRNPIEATLAAMSKGGAYSKAQRDLMGQMLLEGATPENLARIFGNRGGRRGGNVPPAPAGPPPTGGGPRPTNAPAPAPAAPTNAFNVGPRPQPSPEDVAQAQGQIRAAREASLPERDRIGAWQGDVPQKPQSLLGWIRSQGGINDRNYMSGDTRAIMGRANAMPGLINRQSGQGLDDLVAAAYHQGFDVDPDDANSLMRLIEEEAAGNPSYRIGAREEWDVYQEYLASRRGDLPGQTSQSSPAIGGALAGGALSGGATYAATGDEDLAMRAGLVGAIGGGVAGAKFGGGKPPKAPPAAPAFDQRFMKEAQRLVSYNGGVDQALKAQQYVIDQLKNSKAPNAQDRINRAVSVQYAIRRMAERSNRELDEIVPMAEAAPTGPKPIDPNTNYNIDPRGDKFVIRTDAGVEVQGAPEFADRKQALAWLQGETRKARQGSATPPRSGPAGVKPPPVRNGFGGNRTAIGAAGGTALGMATAPDQNGDGVVDGQERLLGGAGGALTGGIVGNAMRRGAPKAPPAGKFRGPSQQTFAGVNAKTADKAALARAQNMEAEGAGRDAIWDATGWFKGVDGKWRFEIDDSGARFVDSEMKPEFYRIGMTSIDALTGKTGKVLDNPEVYTAYPQLGDVSMVQGRFNDSTLGQYSGSFSNKFLDPSISLNLDAMPTNEARRSTALHEVQHGVEDIEGFARGGSPKYNERVRNPAFVAYESAVQNNPLMKEFVRLRASREYADELSANNRMWREEFEGKLNAIEEAAKSSREAWRNAKPEMDAIFEAAKAEGRKRFPIMSRLEDINEQLRAQGVPTSKPNETLEPYEAYRRLAGETEARNVQTRRDFTPEQRRARAPWTTQDVPDDQQIVRFGSGKAESRPKPPPRGPVAQGLRASPPAPKPPKGPPGTVSRMVAGGAVGGLVGSLAEDAQAQEDLTAEMASTKKNIDDLNSALKEWDNLDVIGKQRLLIKLGRVQSTYVNAKGQRVKFDDGTTGDRTEPLFKAYAQEKRDALVKAEKELDDLKKQNAYRQFQKEQNPFYDAVRELGPTGAGILAGVAATVFRIRGVGKSKEAVKVIEKDINDLLTSGPVKGLMKKGGAANTERNRAVNMNEFYRRGGAPDDKLPFNYGAAGYKPNAKAAKPGSLYSSNTTTKMDGVGSQFFRPNDIKIIGAGLLDSVMVRPLVSGAEEELKKAQADVENGNESIEALRRVEKAKTDLAMYQAIERIGWGLAGTGALSAAYRYKLPKPDIRGAEEEVAAIGGFLRSKAPPKTPRTPKALPPPATPPPPVAGPSSQLLLPLLPPPPAPPKPKPKPKKP